MASSAGGGAWWGWDRSLITFTVRPPGGAPMADAMGAGAAGAETVGEMEREEEVSHSGRRHKMVVTTTQ